MDWGYPLNRYARQIILPEVGTKGQAALAGARVLVVGAGGLAASALPVLAGVGVGHLTLLDADIVDVTNLHRQTLFTEEDCGQPKAEVAARRLSALNSEITVEPRTEALTPANAEALVAGADLVLDCADSYAASYTLSDSCLEMGTPLISASVLGMGGYCGGFCADAPSLRAVFPDAPDSAASCATAGVLAPVVAMVGAMQAQMALAVLLGLAPSPLGQMVQLDAQAYRFSSFRFDGAPEPEIRFGFVSPAGLRASDTIVELRGTIEAPEPLHPDALRIAPEDLPGSLPAGDGRLVLCCATGLRAWRAAEQIQQNWPGEITLAAAATS